MDAKVIGKQIARLRKVKGTTQEDLAHFVGVSTQAVSKWENGGVPDTELLPHIADYFDVTIDALFDRRTADNTHARAILRTALTALPAEERFKQAFEYCWDIERALCGHAEEHSSVKEYEAALGAEEQRSSSVLTDYGFTRMGLANRSQYFLLVPEVADKDRSLFDGVNYKQLFADLADKDVFDTCVMFFKRESTQGFTTQFLVRTMGYDETRASNVLAVLQRYRLLNQTQIEMDDEVKTVYTFQPSPAFAALLLFAHELLAPPYGFSFYHSGRNKPYLL